MSINEVNTLKLRSAGLLRHANDALQRGEYDLACFFAEQAVQLRVKALLLRLLGSSPRTHGIRELLGLIINALNDLGRKEAAAELTELVRQYRYSIRFLEDSYISARYISRQYTRDDAEEAVKTASAIISKLDRIEEAVFHEQ